MFYLKLKVLILKFYVVMTQMIKKETIDTNMISDRSDKENQIYSNIKDKNSFKKLMSLGKTYERCISA